MKKLILLVLVLAFVSYAGIGPNSGGGGGGSPGGADKSVQYNNSGAFGGITAGGDGSVLTLSSGVPTWSTPAPASIVWGLIGGTLSNQTDLQSALDAKVNTSDAVSTNTANKVCKRDGSGDFSAGTITAALSGNATTATALAANPTDCSAGQFATAIAANGNLTCSAAATTGASFIPSADATYDIGSTSFRWSDIYAAGTLQSINSTGAGYIRIFNSNSTPLLDLKHKLVAYRNFYLYGESDGKAYMGGGAGVNDGAVWDFNNASSVLLELKNTGVSLWKISGATGVVTHKAGGSTTLGGDCVQLKVNTTAVGNVGAGTDDLITYSIPASTLGTNNDSIEWQAFGTFGATTTAVVTCNYGGTTLASTGSLTVANNDSWEMSGTILRTGATTQIANTKESASSSTILAAKSAYTAPGETLSGAVTIKCTGASTGAPADNDIVQKALIVKWCPAN